MKEIKNVLIVTREYKSSRTPKVGGTGVFYKNLCTELVKRGISVHVFLISKYTFDLEEDGVNIHSIKDIFKANPLLELVRSFTGKVKTLEKIHFKTYLSEKRIISDTIHTWIKKNNLHFDVAETHDFDGLALSIPKGIPYVIRCHGSWSVLEKYFGYKKVHQGRIFCEQEAFKNSGNIITISRYNETINKNLFGIKNSKLIYNGIDEKFYKPEDKPEMIPHSVFYLGNVSYEKGAETLISSFIKLKKDHPEASLHFIGNANHYPEYITEHIEDTKTRNSVHFYGNKSAAEIVQLISKAEVVCFPSKGENFSLSLLEVMAMQKPVICSSIDSFKEIIEEPVNGLIAEEENFHEKISLIFKDKDLRNRLSLNARKLVELQFGIDKMVDETIRYYQEIM
ncbi:glycosyltransferase family 1 protein [Chryseobacterium carnipullorum]|uniref:Glycogen synthase n=1 Tax=Chryseobacterium carnipullorum TaxID=1124835 RepID=A0A376DLZ0_CHRCU|nr:glycosyltransferase family 4 protein [Chryseobacterium carnipullorum]AZA48280.1 glycosyltransferase family 1 protein [Chryseobacterium carnipullorum]AZA67581.1 glycosyltransferase family 1 protein [Chryseobacterium carnipullorum]STC91675.1 Glycogen synthase [Chryseobacterium carnipullorum]